MNAAAREKLAKRQEKLNPFWPSKGICPSCRRDVLADPRAAKEARTGTVTGCPACCRSFVD